MILDFNHVHHYADALPWEPLPIAVIDPENLRPLRFCIVAKRRTPAGFYVIAVRNGYYWLARMIPPEKPFDGLHVCEIAKTDVRYRDDDEIVDED